MTGIPSNVHEGMTVCDVAMEHIGTVEAFQMGDDTFGNEATGVSPAVEPRRNTLTAALADAFTPDDGLPAEMQEKALRGGFVRLDADGLFAADRYIFPEHIDRVEGDKLVLSVHKKDLLKA